MSVCAGSVHVNIPFLCQWMSKLSYIPGFLQGLYFINTTPPSPTAINQNVRSQLYCEHKKFLSAINFLIRMLKNKNKGKQQQQKPKNKYIYIYICANVLGLTVSQN